MALSDRWITCPTINSTLDPRDQAWREPFTLLMISGSPTMQGTYLACSTEEAIDDEKHFSCHNLSRRLLTRMRYSQPDTESHVESCMV